MAQSRNDRRRISPSAVQLPLFALPQSVPLLACAHPRCSRPERRGGSAARIQVLGSGSGGNAILLEGDGQRLLIDAGFSSRELEHRLRIVGVQPSTLRAVVITHEHHDHCRGAARFARRHRVPVFATAGTFRARMLRPVVDRRVIRAGVPFEVAGFELTPFAVPHDAREPVGVVAQDRHGCRIGVVSDLGSFEPAASVRLVELDVLVIETNHDPEMLRTGPYPYLLKRRVAGDRGHLSNPDAARSIGRILDDGLHTVVLYHLSRVNNLPRLARESIGEALDRLGSAARLVLSDQFRPSGWIDLERPAAGLEEATGVTT
jgi:phosphoribosyl 1,2-cyclic phosphodiesterase